MAFSGPPGSSNCSLPTLHFYIISSDTSKPRAKPLPRRTIWRKVLQVKRSEFKRNEVQVQRTAGLESDPDGKKVLSM